MTAVEKTAPTFSLSELAGAFGDFGTIIPLIVAVAPVSSMTVAFLVGLAAAYRIHKCGIARIPGSGQYRQRRRNKNTMPKKGNIRQIEGQRVFSLPPLFPS
jgi:hypothetical protein